MAWRDRYPVGGPVGMRSLPKTLVIRRRIYSALRSACQFRYPAGVRHSAARCQNRRSAESFLAGRGSRGRRQSGADLLPRLLAQKARRGGAAPQKQLRAHRSEGPSAMGRDGRRDWGRLSLSRGRNPRQRIFSRRRNGQDGARSLCRRRRGLRRRRRMDVPAHLRTPVAAPAFRTVEPLSQHLLPGVRTRCICLTLRMASEPTAS